MPCSGAVRADITDTQCVRGLAGGYVGYNRAVEELKDMRQKAKEGMCHDSYSFGLRRRVCRRSLIDGNGGSWQEQETMASVWLENSNVLSLLGAVYPTETNMFSFTDT